MTEIVTYSLRNGRNSSTQFYEDLATFTDTFIAEAETQIGPTVNAFQTYLDESKHEAPRTFAEYAFELLTLGTLWTIYAGEAVGRSQIIENILVNLVKLRKKHRFLKPGIDVIRGTLHFLFLGSKKHKQTAIKPTIENFDQLLHWMAATGDFKEEAKRLQAWRDFLAAQTPQDAQTHLQKALSFAEWFETNSLAVLGDYTPHVDQFLTETHPGYRLREDSIFCGRQRVEYHMNMVGAEILNRSFRKDFLNTKRKVVLLPPCMKARQDGSCEAKMTPMGEVCSACEPGCRVHQITQLGKKQGFNVIMIPHELNVLSNGNSPLKQDEPLGIVGVSCPLTNVTGGWETKRLGIPAQGVMLDYCGCNWHWHLAEGIPTDINFKQLQTVLGEQVQCTSEVRRT